MLFLLKKLLAPILFIIRSVRRALCCFRMKSKQSCSLDDTNYLTHIGIVPNKTEESFDWDDKWGLQEGRGVRKKPLTVQDHITSYREQLNQSNNNADDEVLNNIFEELAPQMITQKRVVIPQEDQAKISEPKNVSRLSVNTNFSNGELVDWIEEVSTGWDEQFVDPMDVLKEYKKQNRENRKQQTIGRKLNN